MNDSNLDHALWHPFADMGVVAHNRLTLTRAEGSWVWDEAGRRYLDATAGLWYSNLGHGRPEIAEAVSRQLTTLDAYSIFSDFANEPALELADRLAALAPAPDSRVFLGTGGGDMIEAAAKIARAHFEQLGDKGRVHLIGRTQGYHGTGGFGTSIGGIPANQTGFGPLLGDVSTVPWADPEALEVEIQRLGSDRVAAFLCEPVIGAGGVYPPPPGYIEAVCEICKRHGVLFIADCVICGFGRLGTWLGIDRWPVQPDMIVLAKGLSTGALPIGALIVSPQIAAPFFTGEPGAPVLRHGSTYAGHPACCVAANVSLDLYERDQLIERGRELEKPLAEALLPLADHPLVSEVRAGVGFLAGVELADDLRREDPGAVVRWGRLCRDEGVLVRPLAGGVAVSPPLVFGEEELEILSTAMSRGLEAL